MSGLEHRVAAILDTLPVRGKTLVLGLSGGRDSVALLHLLHGLRDQLGFVLHAVHVHHGISPFADEWLSFCERQCARLQVPLQSVRLNLQREGGQSLEELARDERYRVLAQQPADIVVLAHHRDDQAETFILQAARGAGPLGLASMPLQRPFAGRLLVRPLLDSSRAEIDAWLAEAGHDWVDDESNADGRYRRNAVRHRVLPGLNGVLPGATGGLARAAAQCAEAASLLHDLARLDGSPDAASLPLSPLPGLSAARARNLVRCWLQVQGVRLPSSAQLHAFVQQVLTAAPDRQPLLPVTGGSVRRFAGELVLVPHWQPVACALHWRGERYLDLPGWQGSLTLEEGTVGLDRQRLVDTVLHIRGRQGGERIQLGAGRPSHTLKNLFQQHGIPPWERDRWPLLFAADQLVAVAGIGVAAQWQVSGGLVPCWKPSATLTNLREVYATIP